MNALAHDLAALVGAHAVSCDEADRSAYAHDLWPRQLLSTRAGLRLPSGPLAIVWPERDEQLAALVRFAAKHGLSLLPYGAGSGVVGAVQPERNTLAVDLKRMRTVRNVDLNRGRAEIEAGILGEHLEEKLRRRGATLGHFPSSIYCSTLGGWVATRSAGQCSGRYGKIEDMVLSVEGVLGTGEPFRAAAPREGELDMRPLIVGSEGTFGFITRCTLRVWPTPTSWQGCAFTFGTMHAAYEAMRALYQSGLRPAVTRLDDPFDSWLFLQGSTERQTRSVDAPLPGRRQPRLEALLRRVLDHPRALNAVAHALGDHVYGRALLLVVFEGTEHDPQLEAVARARALCSDAGGHDVGDAPWRRWLVRRHAVSYRAPTTYARGAWVDTMECAAPWSRLGTLYDSVRDALAGGGFVMAHMSHAYPDGCSIYFTFAGASRSDTEALDTYDATWKRALEAAHRAGGSVAHHHGVGRSKRAAMGLEWGPAVDILRALQHAADPDHVLTRGALVPDAREPVEVRSPSPETLRLDARSRLVEVHVDVPYATLREALARDAFTLPDDEGTGTVGETVGAWLARSHRPTHDPVDHRVAGWMARLPSGQRGGWLAAPRRSVGPDVLPLLARDARFGALEMVTLRVCGDDERAPRWIAPYEAPDAPRDEVLTAWVDRAAAAMHVR